MKRITYLTISLLFIALSVQAQEENSFEKWGPTTGLKGGGFIARVGYVIGGTTPLPLPAEVRKIKTLLGWRFGNGLPGV